jgi:hypothetical protein
VAEDTDESTDRTEGSRRTPGLREALVVGGLTVLAVLAAAVVTYLLPPDARDVVFRTPLLILVLIVGTGAVLWRITRAGPGSEDR